MATIRFELEENEITTHLEKFRSYLHEAQNEIDSAYLAAAVGTTELKVEQCGLIKDEAKRIKFCASVETKKEKEMRKQIATKAKELKLMMEEYRRLLKAEVIVALEGSQSHE